ncbi:MAG: MFS transporter [Raoultibacter sp.]
MTDASAQSSAAGHALPPNWKSIIAFIWAGQAASILTSYAAGYAAIWYLTETTGSALILAIASIMAFLPQGLLSPFGGVIADKFNRKHVMIVSDMGVGLVSLALGIIILMGQASVALIMIMIAARSVGQAFHTPAMTAAMPLLVPEKHLVRINSLDQALMSIAAIGGPALGIFLYTTFGFQTVLFLDFGGAIIACLGLAAATIPLVHDATMDNQHVFTNMHDGWLVIKHDRGMLWLLSFCIIGLMVFAPLSALFPLMTFDHFAGDGYMASITEAAFGVGMLLGSAIIMIWGGGKRLALLVLLSALGCGITILACGLLPSDMFPAFVVLSFIMAIAGAFFNGPLMALLQKRTPAEKMGRVLGIFTAAMGLATPLGLAISGLCAEYTGVALWFVIGGTIMTVISLVPYFIPSVRNLDKSS